MLKEKKSALSVFGVVAVLFLVGVVGLMFAGCGSTNSLTKAEYKEAFVAVSNILDSNINDNSETSLNANLTEQDFITIDNKFELLSSATTPAT